MSDPAVKIGGRTGAVFGVLIAVGFSSLGLFRAELSFVERLILFLTFSSSSSMLLGLLGYFAGRNGAKCRSVHRAFLSGGLLLGLLPFLVLSLMSMGTIEDFQRWIVTIAAVLLTTIPIGCFGAIVCGLGAIVARDCRRFQKYRFPPQYTLQELFIIMIFVGLIVSSIAFLKSFQQTGEWMIR